MSGATFFCLARLFLWPNFCSVGTLSKVIKVYRNANLNFVHDNYRRIHADVIVYIFSHLHTALRIAKISLTSPIVINMSTRELLAGETKSSFV